jgi:hypothetical protein
MVRGQRTRFELCLYSPAELTFSIGSSLPFGRPANPLRRGFDHGVTEQQELWSFALGRRIEGGKKKFIRMDVI